jgi:glutaredoxin
LNVREDEKARNEMIEKSKQMGVPVTIIKNDKGKETIIVGFDPDELADAVGVVA